MRDALAATAALSLLLSVVGCGNKQTFQIAVHNDSARPLTVGVAKEGGPFEPQWASPEQVVVRTNGRNEGGWDSVVVPPGETRSAGPVTGDFSGGARATLRVYAGELKLSDVLAVSRGSPNRVDVPLDPGKNAVIIRDAGGRLMYERADPTGPIKGNHPGRWIKSDHALH